MADVQSPLAVTILSANPLAYGALVVDGGTPAMAHELLDQVKPEQLVLETARPHAKADAMLAGLWLWHDGLEESHRISQSIQDATGSFWHAIMHRREGDFSNSKYWYARVGAHPVLKTLASQAGAVVNSLPADYSILRIVADGWNPNAFVDFVEKVTNDPKDIRYRAAVELQRAEWRALFQYCCIG
jgi:hypothetical protein